MQFEHSAKVKDLQQNVSTAFMDEHIYPNEKLLARRRSSTGDRWQPAAIIEELKPKARAAGLWNLFLPDREHGAGLDQPRVCAAVRDHGPLADGARGVQLLGPRHRQHGSAGPLRHARAEGALAQAAAGRRDSLLLRHDRAGRRLVRRHQHPVAHRARRRRLRDQRPQVVDLRRRRPALQDRHLHGQDRSQGRDAQAAVDDPGADGHARRDGQADADRLRLRRRAARPRRGDFRERPRAGVEPAAGRRPRLRDRAGPARARADSPLHAADRRWPSGRWSRCAGA